MSFSRLFGYKFALICDGVVLIFNLIITVETPGFSFRGVSNDKARNLSWGVSKK